MDVSGWQANVDWTTAWNNGARFAYIKASEGPWTLNDYFGQQYNGSAAVGMIRGAYHFARPNLSSGTNQAQVFIASGGGWANDGSTLPGVLDLESNGSDSSGTCFGMAPGQLAGWAKDFTNTYKSLTGRDAVIYTSYYFWQDCMGASTAFSQSNPLWIAAYGAAANDVWKPGGWAAHTIWQYADAGTFPGDQDVFNGSFRQLQELAGGTHNQPLTTFQQVAVDNPGLGSAIGGIFCDLARGGCIRPFQNGDIYRTPTGGVFTIGDPIRISYVGQNRQEGALGYPISAQVCGLVGGGCQQDFEGGSIYIVPGGAIRIVPALPLAKWRSTGAQGGPLGYPITNQYCSPIGHGCQIDFTAGSIYTQPGRLPYVVSGPVRDTWWRLGGHAGNLGYPVSDYGCGLIRGGCQQDFVSGSFYATPANLLLVVSGTYRSVWWSLSGQGGELGYPITSARCGLKGGGCQQDFENGTIYATPAGSTFAVRGIFRDKYWQLAGQGGSLGYPVSPYRCGLIAEGCQQDFEGGSIYSNPSTGTRIVLTSTRTLWWALEGQGGALGYPKSDLVCGLLGNACVQDFQNGSIYLTPSNDAKATVDPIRAKWWSMQGQAGILGYPTSNLYCGLIEGGCSQDFTNGTIYITPSHAVLSVTGNIRSQWWARAGQGGELGYPIAEQVCIASSCSQQFAGGVLKTP
ncbi:GH25 family lysozyme [Arthrobacter cryoconiti]|uniref:GH25 family lysozyme n=2 Tax=Arthrobacter cryoconiti TaxID=748907 RepID=A0ABV8QY54_9MICC